MNRSIKKRLVGSVRVNCYSGVTSARTRAQPITIGAKLVLVWLSENYLVLNVFGVFKCESVFHCLSAI